MDEPSFTAQQVIEIAGLSYRQINDWDSRGQIVHERPSSGGWRRFTANEVFLLTLYSHLRKEFGVPLSSLGLLRETWERDGVDPLSFTAQIMSTLGISVWLVTDLRHTFSIESNLELGHRVRTWQGDAESDQSFILVKLNPIVNRVLGELPGLEPVEPHGLGQLVGDLSDARKLTPEEQMVASLVRRGDTKTVELKLRDGELRTVRTTEHKAPTRDMDDIEAILSEHDYQSLTIVQKGGQVVSLVQEATARLPIADGRGGTPPT